MNIFNKKKYSKYQIQLRKIYKMRKYPLIPDLPPEEEAKQIVESHSYTITQLVPKEYLTVVNQTGLLRGHIVLLWWINNSRTNKDNPPKYFLNQYGINLINALPLLRKKGLIKNYEVTSKGLNIIEDNQLIIDQHRMKKSINFDGNVTYVESSILKGKEKQKLIQKEAITQIKDLLISIKKNGYDYYEIIADSDEEDIMKLDGEKFKVSEAEIGLTCPPFHLGDRSSIAAYFDSEEWDRDLKRRGL